MSAAKDESRSTAKLGNDRPCQECSNYYSGKLGGMNVGVPFCKGDPDGRKYDWNFARRNENLCGSSGRWASFPNDGV
jgi:hypothetical protein